MEELEVEVQTPETSAPAVLTDVPVPATANLEEFRQAKRHPEKVVAEPVEKAEPVEAGAPKKSRAEKEQDRINDAVRRGIETYKAEHPAAVERPAALEAKPVVEAKPAVEAAEPAYKRFMKMPGFPNAEEFKTQGKTYDELVVAQQAFIAETLHEERSTAAKQHETEQQFVTREKGRYKQFSDDLKADKDIMATFEAVQATGQWPVNAPISREVASLKPFSQIPVDAQGKLKEPVTVYHAIAEKLMDSPVRAALARHLSKDGNKELMRLAACSDPISLGVEVRLIEHGLKTPKLVKTETALGDPLTTLTSVRATDPADPEEAAMRNRDTDAYIRAKRDKRLRAAGKL